MKAYGLELIIDLKGCDVRSFNREHIGKFFDELCDLIEMEKCEVHIHFWDDVGVPPDDRVRLPSCWGISSVDALLSAQKRPDSSVRWGSVKLLV